MTEVSAAKKRSIVAYRKKAGLCAECGCVEDGTAHVCYENYVKTDMREIDLATDDVVSTTRVGIDESDEVTEETVTKESTNVSEEEKQDSNEKQVEVTNAIKTVISYRDRKGLCIKCGKVDADIEHTCVEDYTHADMRTEEEKEADDRTIRTPKEQKLTITEQEKQNHINKAMLEADINPMFKLTKSQDLTIQRDYIMIDLSKSATGQKFDVGYIEYMSHKYKNMIIFIIGDLENTYTFKELTIIKKIANVCPIVNLMRQNIVNYLHGCKRFFGFPSDYITYCMIHKLPATVFFDNESNYDLPCNIVDIKNNYDVDRVVVSQNVLAWKM